MRISWCSAERINEVMSFVGQEWRANHVLARDHDLFRWQYRDPDDDQRLSILLAEDDALAGFLGVIRTDFTVRGPQWPCGWLALWFTRRSAPPSTGWQLLRTAMNDRFKIIATVGYVARPREIYRSLKFHLIDALPRWVKPYDPDGLARLFALADKPLPPLPTAEAPRDSSKLVIRPWTDQSAAAWDDTWEQKIAPRLTGAWRDAAYIKWRYLEHPRFSYAVQLSHDADGGVGGLLVYRLETVRGTALRVMRIVEFLWVESRHGAALAAACDAAARQAGVTFADFYCSEAAFASPLMDAGFTRQPPDGQYPELFQPLEFRSHPVNAAVWADASVGGVETIQPHLYVTRSDGDQDRPN